ncbi:MAG: TylF/MycF/NovP-related O-methyltransferase [Beijerinckiaceae bacterium]
MSGRLSGIKNWLRKHGQIISKVNDLYGKTLSQDGVLVYGKNLGFLEEPAFKAAWEATEAANRGGWPAGVPDVRWRTHIALWAARHGLKLEGDFVECGVHTGLFSVAICHALDFANQPRSFYLFDTFNGIPLEAVAETEMERVVASNAKFYRDVFDVASRNFALFPNAKLIKGNLPDSLAQAPIEKIAYLSVDLNNAAAEHAVIMTLWDRLVPGAVVLIDDYAWETCEDQYAMWNAFAAEKGLSIATLPTGQGLLLKPPAITAL